MKIKTLKKSKFTQYIKSFDFEELFNETGWNSTNIKHEFIIDNQQKTLVKAVAEKEDFVIFQCQNTNDKILNSNERRKIHSLVNKTYKEHLIIFIDKNKTKQIWQIKLQKENQPKRLHEVSWNTQKDTEELFQRLKNIVFHINEEGNITIFDVKNRVHQHFSKNTEKVTKKFYQEFRKQHDIFFDFIKGIDDRLSNKDNLNKKWYASVMLNRLMFCYFIQKKGFLNQDINYLQNKLKESKENAGENQFYNFYKQVLRKLFHQALAEPIKNRKQNVKTELGKIPYLNGGIFEKHTLEIQFEDIEINDQAFEKLFHFFDQWNWHLDQSATASGKDINPDVLGYIFEKYINEQERGKKGAYYTKEDITEYISKNTIIPFLFDKVKEMNLNKDGKIWDFLKQSGDNYIYESVKKGIDTNVKNLFHDLPTEVKKGFDTELKQKKVCSDTTEHLWQIRKVWNKTAPSDIALPTETYRELIERRKRYQNIKQQIESGNITSINDFITYNLNIRQFTQDIIENTNNHLLVIHLFAALKNITILDPTCGSGAFLFAALNILLPLYDACISKMQILKDELPKSKHKAIDKYLNEIAKHPNRDYFILKSIILNNLYGVDIMRESIEIAKLRLFLKLVATVELNPRKENYGLEPLPDIDFNIKAGNTLIGFANEEELLKTIRQNDAMFSKDILNNFKEEFELTSKIFQRFQDTQLLQDQQSNIRESKQKLQKQLKKLNEQLHLYLAGNYMIEPNSKKQQKAFEIWKVSHQPFHWVLEFYNIVVKNKGFDVIIGNPPYVEYKKVKYKLDSFITIKCGNLYSYVMERNKNILQEIGYTSMIVPLSGHSTKRMLPLKKTFYDAYNGCYLTNLSGDANPSKLFEGVKFRLAIFICSQNLKNNYTTQYLRWYANERPNLFNSLVTYQKLTVKYPTAIPKHSNKLYETIILKVKKQKNTIYNNIGKYSIFYHNTPVNWIRSHSFIPYFRSERDGIKVSTQLKKLKYESLNKSKAITCIIVSSLFFIHWLANSDCYHLNKPEIVNFKFDDNQKTYNRIVQLANELSKDLKSKSKRRVYTYSTSGRVEYDEFYMKKSKHIIDKIDTILAEHYDFTEEELDFIINYDIKYRMGELLEAYVNQEEENI